MTVDPINQTLLAVLQNQRRRVDAALEEIPDAVFSLDPGGGCHSILQIGRHLVNLQQFQLSLLASPLAGQVVDPDSVGSVADLVAALRSGLDLLSTAVAEHDPDDWNAEPAQPREGPWGDEPTLNRVVRPMNDFTNHLGAVRAIRHIHGSPAERTQ